jgi:hypothetical protein
VTNFYKVYDLICIGLIEFLYLLKGMMTKYLHQNIDSSKETKTIKYSGINRIARVIIDQEV